MIINHYAERKITKILKEEYSTWEESPTEALVDLMTDILHYAQLRGLDMTKVIKISKMQYIKN